MLLYKEDKDGKWHSGNQLWSVPMLGLREAIIKDLELLNHWDTKQHVIGCDPDDDWNWETRLDTYMGHMALVKFLPF